jgi:hypothetical protein
LPAALAYLLTAALLLYLAHRWVQPLSRRAALALAALPLCVTGKALLLGRVYSGFDNAWSFPPLVRYRRDFGMAAPRNGMLSDLYCQIIPWQKAVRWAIAHGDWPLWNPFIHNGDILAAAAQPAPYLPLNVISYLLPLPAALTYLAAANLLCAALGAFLWARELGCREMAALLGALGWMAADAVVWWIGWPLGVATAVAPWVFLGVHRVVRSPGPRSAALLVAAFVWLLLAGHPETAAHVVLVALAYGVFALWALRRDLAWLRPAGWAVGAGATALLLCAIYLLPILDALPQSMEGVHRREHYAGTDRSVGAAEALRRMQSFVVPFRFGQAHRQLAADLPRSFELLSVYGGSLLIPLALHGLAASRRRERWFLAGMAAVCALAAASAPGVADAIARLPLFDVAINERLAFAAALAVAILAALGAEAWFERPSRRLVLAVVLWLGAAAVSVAACWPIMRAAGLSSGFLAERTAWLLAPLAVAAILIWPSSSRRLAGPALFALLLAQRTWELAGFYPALPASTFYPRVPPLEALPASEEPYRVTARWFAMPANVGALWELEDPRGYQALSFQRLVDTYPLWSGPKQVWFNRIEDLSRPFLQFLNVRYVLVDDPGVSPPSGWRRVRDERRLQLWEQRRVAPRAFVPAKIWSGASWREARDRMLLWDNFRRRVWIEPLESERRERDAPAPPIEISDNGKGRVEARADGTGYRLRADLKEPAWIATSITAWRGWRATANGERLPLAYANHAFVAIRAPAGRYDIELEYLPDSFVAGAWLSALTAGGLLAAALWRRRAQRRSTSMASP